MSIRLFTALFVLVALTAFAPAPFPRARVDRNRIDLERVIALKPDLLVVWLHGNAQRQLEQLRRLGIPLFYSEPRRLDDIADSLLRLVDATYRAA